MSNKLRLTNISDRKPNINNRNDLIDSLNSILEHIQSQITVLLTIKKPEGNNIRSAKFRTLKDNFFDELTVYLVNTNYYEYKDISDNNIKYDKVYELLIKSFETIKENVTNEINFSGNTRVFKPNDQKNAYFGGGVLGGCVMLLNNAVAVLMIMCVLLIMYIIYLYYTNYNNTQNNKPQNNYNPYDIMY